LAPNAEEGRGTLRKASGSRVQTQYPRISEWGNPLVVNAPALSPEHIGWEGERGELKHLSSPRKREYSLSSGERKGNSPNHSLRTVGLKDFAQGVKDEAVEAVWEGRPERVTAPYTKPGRLWQST
jgi:hypothetical protein